MVGVSRAPASISGLNIDSNLAMGVLYQVMNRIVAAGNTVLDSVDAVVQVTSEYTTYQKKGTLVIPNFIDLGVVRTSVAIKPDYTTQTAYIKWMLNDVVSPGGEQTFVYVDASTYGTKTEDIVVHSGDKLEWWMKCSANYYTYKEVRMLGEVTADTPGAWSIS